MRGIIIRPNNGFVYVKSLEEYQALFNMLLKRLSRIFSHAFELQNLHTPSIFADEKWVWESLKVQVATNYMTTSVNTHLEGIKALKWAADTNNTMLLASIFKYRHFCDIYRPPRRKFIRCIYFMPLWTMWGTRRGSKKVIKHTNT